MRVSRKVALTGAVLATSGLAVALNAALASGGDDRTVNAVGDFKTSINRSFTTTFRFDRDVTVRPGQTVTWHNEVGGGEMHTITLAANRAALPSNIDEVMNCGGPGTACEPAAGHVDDQFNPIPGMDVIDPGNDGLNAVGDSLLLAPMGSPGETISAKVTAPAGTTLFYVCAVHPWMQGRINVK
jgi:plastocyanin